MCLAQGHTTVMPVRLKHTTPQSRVKHSTTESVGPDLGPKIDKGYKQATNPLARKELTTTIILSYLDMH